VASSGNPLDGLVTVPRAVRTASGHLVTLCAAATQAAGRNIECVAIGLNNDDWYRRLLAVPGGAMEWGANGVSARDALIDLLSQAATSFSRRLYCANPETGDRVCVVNLDTVKVAKADSTGALGILRLDYDRRAR
jgi:hypothetical protein